MSIRAYGGGMIQGRKSQVRGSPGHLFEWVENKLRPISDSPPVGIYSAAETVDLRECPVCGHSMREHTIDHSTRNTILNCPAPHNGAWDRDAFEPVNEFGMVIRRSQAD